MITVAGKKLAPLARAKVNANDVVAINALMTTGLL